MEHTEYKRPGSREARDGIVSNAAPVTCLSNVDLPDMKARKQRSGDLAQPRRWLPRSVTTRPEEARWS